MDYIKKEGPFSNLSLYQQHEGDPQEPAGEMQYRHYVRL